MRSRDMQGTLPAGDASIERNGAPSFRPAAVAGPACAGTECDCLARFRRDWLSRVEASGLARTEGDDADWLAARGAASLPMFPGGIAPCAARCCRPLASSSGAAS
ncbi:hypothetical protein [Reyranella sp.]|uniref:hypothetical protein n=1 Tax=Reyranella sp. TaxID=1929291 RepID=UPI000BDD8C3F|nr:hypothetical protein [Reyranella sp.]OYY40497.1 MAG: hypothetical protein B7Y57_17465 [Rhodospirillales bacterium 35-66-84]OYZ93114.1 MAG: hypothetical protein B7Y08_18715 [Rhodospirillales bacterium 24-66-33]OZB24242.1 MAG: hypothetical protein B7X63_16675 [Rhodospirillales bacterium 39-66-50]HQS18631.1 hypothetical protein [Reyranella sp.]HQT14849.1 hypothetical protein [Reyranella sp.]